MGATQSSHYTAEPSRLARDRLALRVWAAPPAPYSGYGVAVAVNSREIPIATTSVYALAHSVIEPGEHFISTCSCGDPGCAGIQSGVLVRHEPGLVVWYAPAEFLIREDQAGSLPHTGFRFDRNAYRREVIRCLRELIRRGQAVALNEKPFAVLTDTVDLYETLLQKVLAGSKAKAPAAPSAQDRLMDAIHRCDRNAMDCALADGADLLDAVGAAEAPWAYALSSLPFQGHRACDFILHAGARLRGRLKGARLRTFCLQTIINDWTADVLYRLGRPGAALALTAHEVDRCRQWVERSRLAVEASLVADDADRDGDRWAACLEGRRRLLELRLMQEALERIAKERATGR